MSGPATLRDFRASVQASVARVGRSFRTPEDDWTSVMFIQSPEGVDVVALTNDLFASGFSKDVLSEFLRRLVVERGAYRYALLTNAHMAPIGEEDEETLERYRRDEIRIEQLENATEVLVLCVGDAETEELWVAPIERDARYVRRCGPWDGSSFESFSGRFTGINRYL